MKKTRFTEEQSIGVVKWAEAGQTAAELCRSQGSSEATCSRWKAQDGGLEVSQLRRLREVEDEHRRLKQIGADLTLDNTALQDVPRGTG